MATQMTREEYERKYGAAPDVPQRTQMTGAQYDEQYGQEKPGFLKSLAMSTGVPRLAANVVRAGQAAANVGRALVGKETKQIGNEPVNMPWLGDVKPVGQEGNFGEKLRDTFGESLKFASTVAPVGGGAVQVAKQTLRGKVLSGALTGAGAGAAGGTLYGAGEGMQREGATVGSTIGEAAFGGAVGAAGGTVLGGAAPIIGKTARAVFMPGKTAGEAAQSLRGAAGKIQTRVIRPTRPDIRAGYKDENVVKHQIFGSLDQALEKTSTKLKTLNSQLKGAIKEVGDVPTVKLATVVDRLKKTAQPGSGDIKQFGSLAQKNKAFREMEDELDLLFGNDANGVPKWRSTTLTFEELIDLKRRVGLRGAFEYDPLTKKTSPVGEAYNKFYDILKKEAEQPWQSGQFKNVNKQISELIPIEQAIIRRLPVEERNNAIGLIDSISGGLALQTGDPMVLTVAAANRAMKSGRVAGGLNTLANRLQKFSERYSRTPNVQSAQTQTAMTTRSPMTPANTQTGQNASKVIPKNSEAFAGAAMGFEMDEEGNLTFNPETALMGIAGVAVGTKLTKKQLISRARDFLNDPLTKNEMRDYIDIVRLGKVKVKGGMLQFESKEIEDKFWSGMSIVDNGSDPQLFGGKFNNTTPGKIADFFEDVIDTKNVSGEPAKKLAVQSVKDGA